MALPRTTTRSACRSCGSTTLVVLGSGARECAGCGAFPTWEGQTVAETFRNVQANLEFAAQPAAGFYGAGQAPSLERIVAQVAELHQADASRLLVVFSG